MGWQEKWRLKISQHLTDFRLEFLAKEHSLPIPNNACKFFLPTFSCQQLIYQALT